MRKVSRNGANIVCPQYRFKTLPCLFHCVPTGVQLDVSHAHAQRQEAVHLSSLRQRVLPELRPQETLAQTSRRPLSAASARNGRSATGHSHRRTDDSTAFAAAATAAAQRLPRPRYVRATVPDGPDRTTQERDNVTRLATPVLSPKRAFR